MNRSTSSTAQHWRNFGICRSMTTGVSGHIEALVPLARLDGHTTALRSLSQGGRQPLACWKATSPFEMPRPCTHVRRCADRSE